LLANVTTIANGNYEGVVDGTFSLFIDESYSNDMDLNMSATDMVDALSLIPNVEFNVSTYQGVLTVDNFEYYVYQYNLTLHSPTYFGHQNANNYDLQLLSQNLSGSYSVQIKDLEEPQEDNSRLRPIEVSFNDQVYSDNSIKFLSIEPLIMDTLEPKNGPYSGNTRVSIKLSNLNLIESWLYSASIRCVFYDSEVPGRIKDFSSIECVTPPYFSYERAIVPVRLRMY
jgi:hypothetical protein